MRQDRNRGMSTIPGLIQIQLEGFFRFIDEGLAEELSKFSKEGHSDPKWKRFLLGLGYRLLKPLIKERDALYKSLTYSSKLFVYAGVTRGRKIQEERILIGNIPIMNCQGAFLVNGIYRILINQILQSPGIYYRSKRDSDGNLVYTCTIISDWGRRFDLEIDGKARLWVRIKRKKKISILVLSSSMGFNLHKIPENVYSRRIFYSFLDHKANKTIPGENGILLALGFMRDNPGWRLDIFGKNFFDKTLQLGRMGRRNMNRRLNLSVRENSTFLLPQDILVAADHLIGLKLGIGTTDDMNHLKNKRIRSVADLLQDMFRLALKRLDNVIEASICQAIRKKRKPNKLVTVPLFTTTFESFFGLHPLSQVFDQTNPLAQIVHGRKWSYLGPTGLTSRTASIPTRDIHPSYYGRLCPIDTSEGINVGLTGSLALHARIGPWGSLESPFYEKCDRSKRVHMLSLSSPRDEYYMITVGTSLALNEGIQEEQVVPARYRQEFLTIAWEEVQLRSIFPFQYFSIGASLIPFIEHNDATRALMSSNMQRQAVPLLQSEKCIVGTGVERQVAFDSGNLALAQHAGKIISKDTDKIKIRLAANGHIRRIPLVLYQRSNKNTWIHQKSQIQPGKGIKRGQILADGAATVGGELALGKNVLVGYMPWEGYNFEDAVLISERLVYEDIYTSFHIRKYGTQIDDTTQGPERVTAEIPDFEEDLLRNLDKKGIVKLGSWVETGDVLVGKLTPPMENELSYAPEERLLRAILGIPIPTEKETCLKLPIGGRGRVIDVRWIPRSKSNPEKIQVYILQKRKIKVGDKVAGRHGNKGVISKILPRQDMPYLQDGRPLDMVFNPLGVPSRMNVGQILECSLGLAGLLLDRHYRIPPFDERYEQDASRKLVFSELYEASKQTANPWVFEPEYPGKSRIFDGRSGDAFEQPVIIGNPYILKLIHQVDDKIHGRSSGPYALVTQQPLRGRAKQGGQRVGEMEVWALEGFGVAHILQEMLTYKSDHIKARQEVVRNIIIGAPMPKPADAPESFRLLVRELRSLALELNHSFPSR
uniref:DNA-directed RNA polymerase subunit beta n=1 Tax=Pharnaceum aurantium TaxID=2518628 RepID=A0A411L956_9CARY|nr:RNA polymerase beta subunit [Pharnaceum aurantium]